MIVKNPFRRKPKEPNPHTPDMFSSAGGWEMYKLLFNLSGRIGRLEGRQAIILALILAILGVILAKLQGAF